MLHVLIMAGGSGTRFWPESRRARPKQLLPLVDERSMIRATFDRVRSVVPTSRVWLALGTGLVDAVRTELPEVDARTYVVEPCQRNTAPCIGLAALRMLRDDPDAVMLVLPSDHAIRDVEAFRRAVTLAERLAAKPRKQLVTFGIRPTYPAEGFGYIERGATLSPPRGAFSALAAELDAYEVVRFREKPKQAQAEEFLQAGTFYWNSGMFVWRADVIVAALAAHEPEMPARLRAIVDAHGEANEAEVLATEFPHIRGISIDYAVLERSREVVVIEAPFDWDDVGSWGALARLRGTDARGNTIVGKFVGHDTSGTIVRTDDRHLVATLGLKDCIVVHTPDATLVADRRDEESVRRLVEMLKERGWEDVL